MTIKTIKITGFAYGDSPATVEITANENVIFSGEVPVAGLVAPSPISQVPESEHRIICSFDLDFESAQLVPMTCQVQTGTVIFAKIYYNYAPIIPNPAFTAELTTTLNNSELSLIERAAILAAIADPPLNADEIGLLENPETSNTIVRDIMAIHKLNSTITGGVDDWSTLPMTDGDPRINVKLNDVDQLLPDRSDLIGTWWWKVTAGSTLSYDLELFSTTV
jgi:hypothetical protein